MTIKNGTRVQLHPATDAWMRGDRYGEIVKADRKPTAHATRAYYAKLDKSGRTIRVGETLFAEV